MSVVKWLLYTDKLNNSTLFFRNHAKILGFSFLAGKIINRFHANDNFTQRGGKASDWVCLAGAENSTIENTTLFKQILPVKILVNWNPLFLE